MSPYEQRLEGDIQKIQTSFSIIKDLVVKAQANALKALLERDDKLASDVMIGDRQINHLVKSLNKICYAFIVKYLPTAKHLRFVSTVMRAIDELERIGDYAVTICRESVQLSCSPSDDLRNDIERIANLSVDAFSQAIIAFSTQDEKVAKSITGVAEKVVAQFDEIYAKLVDRQDLKRADLFAYLVIFNMFLRVADRTINICEETVFMMTGETRQSRPYTMLFIDEDNSCLSQIAEAIARKQFSDLGEFASVGRNPVENLDSGLIKFLQEYGVDTSIHKPTALTDVDYSRYYILISLKGAVKSYVDKIPFHSIALEWDIDTSILESNSSGRLSVSSEDYEKIFRDISSQMHDLMQRLREDEAI